MTNDDINRRAFREEAAELLAELETALLELEDSPDDHELVDRVFRAMHTIKGSGAMFGFDDVAAFTHDVETVFDLVRNGVMPVTKQLLDLTLAARDAIAYLLQCSETGEAVDFSRTEVVTRQLRELTPEGAEHAAHGAGDAGDDDAGDEQATYRIRYKPDEATFHTGSNPLALLDELAEKGPCRPFAHLEQVPALEQLDPEACHVWWDVILSTSDGVEAIRDVFLFVEEDCELGIKLIDETDRFEEQADYKKLGEILVERGDVSPEDVEAILTAKPRLGEMLAQSGLATKSAVQSALAEQQAVREIRQTRAATRKEAPEAAASIRVAAEKLDFLVDLVGELVIVQARISQVVGEKRDPVLTSLAEELERLSDELRDSTLDIRMLPIGATFSKFRRLVRDLSDELGKEIELVTHGAETELDKTVIERLGDPLVHLLRNSIDHGVESPQEREALGKPRAGVITLTAEQAGGEVIIRIADDGKGVNIQAVRERAVARGLITPEAELSNKEIYNLIFQPGFSTAEKVTSVSGRGVGMDVVKRSIDALRGSVEVDSEPGRGSTLTIKLPLTLAIIDGLQVKVGEEYFVIPLTVVEECVELANAMPAAQKRMESATHNQQESALQTVASEGEGGNADGARRTGPEQRIVNLRGEIVPYIRLREFFHTPGERPRIEQIVVAGIQGGRVGIVVDHVVGEHQTVIKSLGRLYRDVEGVSGATIKGDGSMALILDVPKLVQCVNDEQNRPLQ